MLVGCGQRSAIPLRLSALGLLMLCRAPLDATELPRESFIRSVVAARAAVAPVIDGLTGDRAWARAGDLGPLLIGADGAGGPQSATSCRVVYDDVCLYVMGEMDPVPEAVMTQDGPRDDEALIVYLNPSHDHRRMVEVTVDSTGWLYSRPLGYLADPPSLAGIRAKAKASAGGWTAELAIPWAALAAEPADGDVWGLNIIRDSVVGPEREAFLSPTFGDRDRADRFTDLFFGAPRVAVEGIRVEGEGLGESRARLWFAGPPSRQTPARVRATYRTPFGPTTVTEAACHLRDEGPLEAEVPFRVTQAGKGELGLEVLDARGGVLYGAAYPQERQALVIVPGAGRFAFSSDRPAVAPGAQVSVRLSVLERDPSAPRTGEFRFESSFIGPDGRAVGDPQVVLRPAVELGALDLTFRFVLPAGASGPYTIRIDMQGPTGGRVARLEQGVLCDEALLDRSGLQELERRLAGRPPGHDAALPARYLLDLAWPRFFAHPWVAAEVDCAGKAVSSAAAGVRDVLDRGAVDPRARSRRRETVLLAYRSSLDGSIQPYGLSLPERLDTTRPIPLVVNLHGWDSGNGPFALPSGSYDPERDLVADRGWLMVYPFGRGNQDWRDAGEVDVREVIAEVSRRFPVDVNRIYLVGFSMGGRGVWHLAMRYPSDWAAVVPIAGSSAGSVWGVWNEERLVTNLSQTPVFAIHGTRDEIVPVTGSRVLEYQLRRVSSPDLQYRERPFAGHESMSDLAREWVPWLERHALGAPPMRVSYSTDSARFGRAFFVRITQLDREGRAGSVAAHIAEGNAVDLLVDGVNRLSLDLGAHPAIESAQPVTISVNRAAALRTMLPPAGTVELSRAASGTWALADGPVPAEEKRGGFCGPMRDAIARPFALVYGTRGSDPELVSASYSLAQEAAKAWREWWWGTPLVLRDVDVTPELMASHNLLLFGGESVNDAVARLAARLPWRDGRPCSLAPGVDPRDMAYKFVYPNPDAPGRYVVVMAAQDPVALHAIGRLGQKDPYPAPLGTLDVDYIVAVRRRIGSTVTLAPVAEGWFDNRWRLPSAAPGRIESSGRGWLASISPLPGWQTATVADASFGPALVMARTAVDNEAWRPFELRSYHDVLHRFDTNTAVLWASGDPPPEVCWFRRTLTLPQAPARAPARILMDDRGRLFVNGQLACATSTDEGIIEFDLAPWLHAGENILAAEVGNLYGARGFAFECTMLEH